MRVRGMPTDRAAATAALATSRGADPAVEDDRLPVGATQTFDGFYRRELPRLVTFAAALAGAAAADDVAQEAMLAAYRRWEVVSQLDLPAAWVRRVCANTATSLLRRRGAEARALMRLGARRQQPFEVPPEPDNFWCEVRRLPRRQAQAVALAYVYGLGVKDIAATLGVADGTVKAHLSRGRATLAARLFRTAEEQDA